VLHQVQQQLVVVLQLLLLQWRSLHSSKLRASSSSVQHHSCRGQRQALQLLQAQPAEAAGASGLQP
jgi:hypothetical protein